jgi:Stigma-specific protein, Stig1
MRPPGFSAEASLYRSRQYYATALLFSIDSAPAGAAIPAAPIGATINVGGTIWDNNDPCLPEVGPCDQNCQRWIDRCGRRTHESCCGIDAYCQDGTCICRGNKRMCGGVCVDVLTDPNHCGSCNHPCFPGGICTNGTCSCPPGTSACGGTCCRSCCGGICCPPGMSCCNGRCTAIATDPANCGGCGNVCSPPSSTCCGGVCADVSNDPVNCGQCGNACATGSCCYNGACGGVPGLCPSPPGTLSCCPAGSTGCISTFWGGSFCIPKLF